MGRALERLHTNEATDRREVVASHYDGTRVTEVGRVRANASASGDVRIVPTAAGAALVLVRDRADRLRWYAATVEP
jgi:hypothetical protein